MLDIKEIIKVANGKYAKIQEELGMPWIKEMPSNQIHALAAALVEAINKETR